MLNVGSGELKKWRRWSTMFECKKRKFVVLFYAPTLLINFLHRRRRITSFRLLMRGELMIVGIRMMIFRDLEH